MRLFIATTAALMVIFGQTGCSSSSDDDEVGSSPEFGNGDEGLEAFVLDERSGGLTNDAGRDRMLYFTDLDEVDENNLPVNPKLMAVDPAFPDTATQVDDDFPINIQFAGERTSVFSQLFTAESIGGSDSTEKEWRNVVTGVHVYTNMSVSGPELRTLGAEAIAGSPPSPDSWEVERPLPLPSSGIRAPNYDSPEQSRVAIGGIEDDDPWRQVALNEPDRDPPLEFPEDHIPVHALLDTETGQSKGWIAVDLSSPENPALVQLPLSGDSPEPITDESGNQVDGLEYRDNVASPNFRNVVTPLGPTLNNGAQLLVLWFKTPGDLPDPLTSDFFDDAEVWVYQPGSSGEAGSLNPLTNGQGETLSYSVVALAGLAPALPQDNQKVSDGDALYLTPTSLFTLDFPIIRADDESWEVLVEAAAGGLDNRLMLSGDRLVWFDTARDKLQSIRTDGTDTQILMDGPIDVETPLQYGGDEWVFINVEYGLSRTDHFAVALRPDGSEQLNIPDAEWVGASTDGTALAANPITGQRASEVFLLSDDGELAAVDAEDVAAGKVVLGHVPAGTDVAEFKRPAPGPHRLIRTISDSSPEAFQIHRLNTREPGSLAPVSDAVPGAGQLLLPLKGS